MNRVYLDSSALLKRVLPESESPALVEVLDIHHRNGDVLFSSSLAWIETARALRRRYPGQPTQAAIEVEAALSGVAECPIDADVVSLARRVGSDVLRSLDAIHLASALLSDTDLVLGYDERLLKACAEFGLPTAAPA